MDIYSALQSPSISLFSPGLHHRLSASQLSLPRVGSVLVSGTPPLRIPLLGGHTKKDSEEFVLPYTDPVRKLEDQFVKTDSAIYVADDGKVVVLGSSFVQGLFNGQSFFRNSNK